MNTKRNNDMRRKIAGAVYGFAIGDSMGATTEFMTSEEIKMQYGIVDEIIGGGWLDLNPGDVTDDTQMTTCVAEAIISTSAINNDLKRKIKFEELVKKNFISWYKSNPPDVGNQCAVGIETLMVGRGRKLQYDKNACGNGSLMRALPCALVNKLDWNIAQGDLTHPSDLCRQAIEIYHRNIVELIYSEGYYKRMSYAEDLMEPTGYIINTLNNAFYWANKDSFKDCIIGAVNHGGDSDTIAAIAGSIAGANFGFENIPEKWIKQLNPNVKKDLEKFIKFIFSYLQI